MSPVPQVKIKRPRSDLKQHRVKVSGVPGVREDDKQWWLLPTEAVAPALASLVERIDNNNTYLREQFCEYARLYGNLEALGWGRTSAGFLDDQNRPRFNVIQSCVDTVHSKIARDNPQPYFITSGADYFDKLKAEKMTQFVQGCFQQAGFYNIANNKVFRDASVYGLGGCQWDINPQTKKLECEWVFVDELKIDQLDAQKGKPLSMHRCRTVQKERLISRYPDAEDEINQACDEHADLFRSGDTVVDFVIITESWHLQIDSRPGRHVVCLADRVLLDEPYTEESFPIVLFSYYEKSLGIYGRGIAETIRDGQRAINELLFFIQQCEQLQGSPYILVDSNSEVAEDALMVNQISRMIPYRAGTEPPQFVSPTPCSPEIYQNLESWITRCYQEIGISQTTAGGQKQAGVDSAVAMRTMVDIESSRFIQVSKNWEAFFVANAEAVVRLGKQRAQSGDFRVQYRDKRSGVLKDLDWSRVNMTDDPFQIQCDTVSNFPSSAAGRIQTITDYISNNFISRERGLELLNLDPDLQDEIKLQTSSLRLTEKRLCEMVEDNLYHHPEKFMNLQLSLQVSLATYNQLQIDNCPDDRMQLVRNWIQELTTLAGVQDPQTAALQAVFADPSSPAKAAQVAPQAGLNPAQ